MVMGPGVRYLSLARHQSRAFSRSLTSDASRGTTRGEGRLDFLRRRHRRRGAHPLHGDRRRCIGVSKRITNGVARRELGGDCADKTIAGAGGIDRLHGAACNHRGFAVDKRKHATLAQRHADDLVLAGLQAPRRLDEAGRLVAIGKLGVRKQAKLGFIEDQDVDEVEQLRPQAMAGAGLRIVVAPAARARSKKALIVGSGISNWLTATSPLASAGAATSAALTSALAPGMTTMVLSALATVMIAVPVWAIRRVLARALRSIPCAARNAFSSSPNASLPSRPISAVVRAEPRGGDRLVGALAAGKVKHGLAGDGFADSGMPVGGCHHIHVDAAGDENAAHALFPKGRSDPDLELLPDGIDVGERRQSRLVAEPLDLVGRRRARELEMLVPALWRDW